MHVTEAKYAIIWHIQHIDANIRSQNLGPAASQSSGEAKCNRKKTHVHPMVKPMYMFSVQYWAILNAELQKCTAQTRAWQWEDLRASNGGVNVHVLSAILGNCTAEEGWVATALCSICTWAVCQTAELAVIKGLALRVVESIESKDGYESSSNLHEQQTLFTGDYHFSPHFAASSEDALIQCWCRYVVTQCTVLTVTISNPNSSANTVKAYIANAACRDQMKAHLSQEESKVSPEASTGCQGVGHGSHYKHHSLSRE